MDHIITVRDVLMASGIAVAVVMTIVIGFVSFAVWHVNKYGN